MRRMPRGIAELIHSTLKTLKPRTLLIVWIIVSVGHICYAFLIAPYFELPKQYIAYLETSHPYMN
jgi:hypothetical protein